MLEKYGQYKRDIFTKIGFSFDAGKKILDVGCGDGSDAEIFIEEYGLDTYGIDLFEHENISQFLTLKFEKADIYKIPFEDDYFDYIFLHDILHHIDEENQFYERHIQSLLELRRVVKPGGFIIIVEGNRYNPLFYPHMVKIMGHDHFPQKYFEKIIEEVFPQAEFKFFEAHSYPKKMVWFWKTYECLMEKFSPKNFLAYNTAIWQAPNGS